MQHTNPKGHIPKTTKKGCLFIASTKIHIIILAHSNGTHPPTQGKRTTQHEQQKLLMTNISLARVRLHT